jgi:hypothetical protein
MTLHRELAITTRMMEEGPRPPEERRRNVMLMKTRVKYYT